MTSVLVQTPGARISARAGRLVVETPDAQQDIPLDHVQELLVVGNARISTAVLVDLAGRGVPVHVQAAEGRIPVTVLHPQSGQLGALRVQLGVSAGQQLRAAQLLVLGKVRNANWALRRMGSSEQVPVPAVHLAPDADALRGLEGLAARQYFAAVRDLLPGWSFPGRVYRPTPDPVNAALSFAYAVLLGRAVSAVAHAGLHQAVGTLHVTHGRRPALALDVMEPFRAPVCDTLVVRLFRSGQLPRDSFDVQGNAVQLGPDGCRTVVHALNARMTSWGIHAAMREQVRAIQRAWTGEPATCWEPPTRA